MAENWVNYKIRRTFYFPKCALYFQKDGAEEFFVAENLGTQCLTLCCHYDDFFSSAICNLLRFLFHFFSIRNYVSNKKYF